MRRFLFLFSDTGGGHRAAAQAVKDEMERLYGAGAAVDMVDVFVELGRWPFRRFPDWYPTCVALSGIPWGVGFHLSDGVKLMQTMSKLVWPYARTPMCSLLQHHPADVIASFHPIPNYALFLGLRQMGRQTPVGVVALDLVTTHAGWFVPGAEAYLVPTYAAKARALRWGVPEERIRVRGMPIRHAFLSATNLPKAEARAHLGLPQDRDIVLIVGGGEGMGPMGQVVRAIARPARRALSTAGPSSRRRSPPPLGARARGATRWAADRTTPVPPYVVVITGKNQALHQELTELGLPASVRIEGFVGDMEIWMRAADLLVTKAGPNSLAEAFVVGLPVVLYAALPGQEEGNVTHVVENGAGVFAPLPKQAARAVARLLDRPDERLAMAKRSRALGRPLASEQIARDLWEMAAQRVPVHSPLRVTAEMSADGDPTWRTTDAEDL